MKLQIIMLLQKQVKIIGSNGQSSLGKAFADHMVLVSQLDKGTWIIKTGEFVPDSEKWLYLDNNLEKIDKALTWAAENDAKGNFEEIMTKFKNESKYSCN